MLTFWFSPLSVASTPPDSFTINNLWLLISTFLVFLMHLGFACLEIGLTRAKNTVNILFKNIAVVAIGLLTYAMVGFGLMYPGEDFAGAFLGFAGFGIGTDAAGLTAAYNPGYTYWSDFLFQAMFAATAATIVSGAVAERIRLDSFLIFATLFVAVCYPVVGFWHWGGGFLGAAGFYDFAGSTVVHSVGGWGALVAAWMLGPRYGKYLEGEIRPILGHSMPLATMGVFFLWFGWYGFNGGSVLSADPGLVSLVSVNTSLAAAAGVMGAIATAWTVLKKPDLSMALNGALAGLVGVTAGANVLSPLSAILVGFVAGLLVVFAVIGFDKAQIDDPVGAISVHLICGIWGTLAVGLFGPGKSIFAQLLGIGVVAVFASGFALAVLFALKFTLGIRVSEHEELAGLDLGEHGMEAYSGFQIFRTW